MMSMKSLLLSLFAMTTLFSGQLALSETWQERNQEYVDFLNETHQELDLSIKPEWITQGPLVFENLQMLEGVLHDDFKVAPGALGDLLSCRIRECHGGGGSGPIPFMSSQLLNK